MQQGQQWSQVDWYSEEGRQAKPGQQVEGVNESTGQRINEPTRGFETNIVEESK